MREPSMREVVYEFVKTGDQEALRERAEERIRSGLGQALWLTTEETVMLLKIIDGLQKMKEEYRLTAERHNERANTLFPPYRGGIERDDEYDD